jgi:8-oxo-dGTP diphosphatase
MRNRPTGRMTIVAPTGGHLLATVCFVCRADRVLLQLRPADRVWGGRWNGPGGKVDPGEAPPEAIVREVAEETGLRIREPTGHGALDLVFGRPEQGRMTVHVFRAERFAGRARGTAGVLRWYRRDRMPWNLMWPDQRYWLGSVLDGGHVAGSCTFDTAGDRLLSWALRLDGPRGAKLR